MICQQAGGYIYQVVSGEFFLVGLVQKKNRPEKCPFIAANNCIVLAIPKRYANANAYLSISFKMTSEKC